MILSIYFLNYDKYPVILPSFDFAVVVAGWQLLGYELPMPQCLNVRMCLHASYLKFGGHTDANTGLSRLQVSFVLYASA